MYVTGLLRDRTYQPLALVRAGSNEHYLSPQTQILFSIPPDRSLMSSLAHRLGELSWFIRML